MTTTNWPRTNLPHNSDFVAVILSQREGLGKMAVGIVKYFYDCFSPSIGVIWLAISLFAVRWSRSVAVDPRVAQIAGLCHSVTICLFVFVCNLCLTRFFVRAYVWFHPQIVLSSKYTSLNVECIKWETFLRSFTRTSSPSFWMLCRCKGARCHLTVLFHLVVKPRNNQLLKVVFLL